MSPLPPRLCVPNASLRVHHRTHAQFGGDGNRYAHRFRKEGHTKIIEYSLVAKQKVVHRAAGIKRKNVLVLQALAGPADVDGDEDVEMDDGADAMDDEDDDEAGEEEDDESAEEDGSGKPKRQRRRRDSSTSEESEDLEKEEMGLHVDDSDDSAPPAAQGRPTDKDIGGASKQKQTERIVPPDEVRAHLRVMFKREAAIVALLYAPHGPLATTAAASSSSSSSSRSISSAPSHPKASADIFFMEVVSVPPTRFRPAATMGDQVFENPQNSLLNGILRQTFVVRDLNLALAGANAQAELDARGGAQEEVALVGAGAGGANGNGYGNGGPRKVDKTRLYTQLLESLINLQIAVNSMVDSTKNPMVVRQGKLPPPGVKQMLEKKEGLFRKNMMVRRRWPATFVV